MAYNDMTRCPQTEAEFTDYFYTLIGRRPGTDAYDWNAVLSEYYPWEGQSLRIPEGVGPGIRQQPGAVFFGLTQQWSNGPKGRIFLPTGQPDALGYYTRCIQYLDNASGTRAAAAETETVTTSLQAEEFAATTKGAKSSGLVWSWYKIDGNAYVPIQGADSGSGGGGTPPPSGGTGLTEAEVQAMIDDSIAQALAPLQAQIEAALKVGDKIALRTNSGLLAGIEGGGPTVADAPIKWIGKTGEPHSWESLTVEQGE